MSHVFRFHSPEMLHLLWLTPVILFLYLYFNHRHFSGIKKHFGEKVIPFLISSISFEKRKIKLALEIITIALLIFTLARPQLGKSEQKVKSEGVELIILFDVSNSMLAEDTKPSRMELAKKELIRFLDLGGGDKVGLVAFAGSAALMSPMTTDKSALKMYIESLAPESVSAQGTDFQRALQVAEGAFKRGGAEEDEQTVVTQAIVVVSDGEDNEKGALDEAKKLKDAGITIFSLAFGTEKGGAIPRRDARGNLRGYRKDKSGKVVMTKTKGTVLREIAQAGGGSFYHVTFGGNAVKQLRSDLSKLESAEFDSAVATDYDEKYQWVLFFALIFALIELALGERKTKGRLWQGRFEVEQQ